MHSFVRNLITEWRRLGLPFSGGAVIVAVSGGADSVSLLLAMADLAKRKKIEHKIIAAHFDHGLRGEESAADAAFVAELANDLRIDIVAEKGNLRKSGNLEQNARRARYEFLGRTAAENDAFAVLTGHTLNDQAETFLLNLIRGSGREGLGAIPVLRPLGDENSSGSRVQLIRPLLKWAKRVDTETYSRSCGIDFRNDPMNHDLAFKRVKIRKELIPLLEQMNPKIVETLAATAGLLSQKNEIDAIQIEIPTELKISELRSMSESDLYTTLRGWLRKHRGNTRGLGLIHIKALQNLILSEKSGRETQLPGGNALRSGGKLVYQKN